MARVFITGITGFIGRRLAKQLAASGHMVWGTSMTEGFGRQLLCDLRNLDEASATVKTVDPEVTIHLAALSSVTAGSTMEYYETNVLATENLLKALEKIGRKRRFLFVSTAGVYGNQSSEVLTESLTPQPVSHYGMSKYVCERMVNTFGQDHDITIFRPFNVIGSGQNSDFVVPKLVRNFFQRQPSIRLGNLDPMRDYLDVESCCEIISALMHHPGAFGETINICSGKGASVRDLLSVLSELTGHYPSIEIAAEFVRRNEVWRLLGSTEKLDRLLPDRRKPTSLHDVLSEMLIDSSSAK